MQTSSEFSISAVSFEPMLSEINQQTQICVSSNIIATHPTHLQEGPVQLTPPSDAIMLVIGNLVK